jgi:thiol:disulfide interchange protein DsbD
LNPFIFAHEGLTLVMKILLLICILLTSSIFAEEKFDAVKMKGVKIELLSEYSVIKPGQKFTVAIHIEHSNGFHTYWKNPGLVGFPTQVKWKLPPGFKAGEIQWQVPEKAKMLKYNCHGYNGDTMLLADIEAPAEMPKVFTVSANVGGMSCSEKSCCSIGFADTSISLRGEAESKTSDSAFKAIKQARKKLPVKLAGWSARISKNSDKTMTLKISGQAYKGEYYFFPDKNIYDTESPQKVTLVKGGLSIQFKLNNYVPADLKFVTGLVYNPSGWGDTGRKYLPVSCELK